MNIRDTLNTHKRASAKQPQRRDNNRTFVLLVLGFVFYAASCAFTVWLLWR